MEKDCRAFQGNPAVAAYDILNEPGIKAAATYSLHWDFIMKFTIQSVQRIAIILL